MNYCRHPYDPELHDHHKRPWTTEELTYLCSMYESTRSADLSFSIGEDPEIDHGESL